MMQYYYNKIKHTPLLEEARHNVVNNATQSTSQMSTVTLSDEQDLDLAAIALSDCSLSLPFASLSTPWKSAGTTIGL